MGSISMQLRAIITLFTVAVWAGCVSADPEAKRTVIRAPVHSENTCALENRVVATKRESIRLAFINTHLLPSVARPFAGNRSNSSYRAGKLGERISASDIVGMCEVFDGKSKELLLDRLRSGEVEYFVADGPARSGRALIGSGLLLVSRYPIVEQHSCSFRDASRIMTSGLKADGLAAKGALHARLEIRPGDYLDCFVTHLESQQTQPRQQQLRQLGAFIAEHYDPVVPGVVMGDFNIVGPLHARSEASEEYSTMLRAIQPNEMTVDDLGLLLPNEPAQGTLVSDEAAASTRIDYIFALRNSSDLSALLTFDEFTVDGLRDENVKEGSLSDHCAILVTAHLPPASEEQRSTNVRSAGTQPD